jgi:putative iron-dependent peroxidase
LSRVVIDDDAGEEIEIYRRSVPYGTAAEAGLYFLAFTDDLTKIDRMLANMYGASGDGGHDRVVEFSQTVSGAYYFAPPTEALARILEIAP